MKFELPDADATATLGRALARTRPAHGVIHLQGDLGAGKSTLARALLRELGVTGAIRSPTYTLVERYAVAGGEAWHLDLYRIGDPGELDFLGLDAVDTVLWLVEWPERGARALPPPDLRVALELLGNGRVAEITACLPRSNEWLTNAAAAFTAGDLHA
ncbi:tRNA (adenosine(37)-N6)-threonylcarbamoyltransferase complex ATPase subunit type 1 TsaE [Lysobacter sp. TY2-98]|uniref:tRNA (adenosine(37)-N6)-threonylcarbamoyltransferase complex ATPase subunit type 1 TsaE n=1 Tax=Lysobacter sp. TY2-98 TaxID=2290922 RepID=UPI000E202D7E|nr:tRNA (adenosine(37)-N6)-threonylcarbamoyltransferase complex ATPase subunit type 1 TsaE [Lysobacter sp. TY2-98]AXK71953.1 tRNA (adenosine(37)-N6)-threonylcarbamoyltransferase complex ATPase subunit type 1 TsaE [Lysobacter sp. TY2-98]